MEFVVEKSPEIKVRIYGQDYSLTKPTHKMAKELAKKIKGAGEDEAYDIISAYIVGLGLPQEVLEGMEADHVLKLCDFLAPKKN